MVETASLYDNFCKTGNDVNYDVIIWVQDGNCKKMTRVPRAEVTKNRNDPT